MLEFDAGAVLAAIRRRDLNCEGIPMLLALNDARPAPPDDHRRVLGARLAAQLIEVHRTILGQGAADPTDATAIETPVDDEDVEAEGRRAVSAEERVLGEAIAVLAHATLDPAGGGAGAIALTSDEAVAAADASEPLDPGERLLGRTVRAWREGRIVAVVNYHNTPASSAEVVRAELAVWGKRCAAVDVAEMGRLFGGETRPDPRLPLIPVFYEGYRNNYEHGAPACENAGLTGWFFLITEFLATAPSEQQAYAQAHHIGVAEEERERERIAMTWEEAADLVRSHVVTAHTANHIAALRVDRPDAIERELELPAREVHARTGLPAVAHAWLHGSGLHGAGHEPDPVQRHRLRAIGCRWLFGNIGIDAIS